MKRAMVALWIVVAAIAGGTLILTACAMNKRHEPPKAEPAVQAERWSPGEYSSMAMRGQKVFTDQCARCHTVDGLANLAAPDLSDYGSEGFSHLRTADFIRDPQLYYPGTKMPSFSEKAAKTKEERLADPQIDEVTAYIRGLMERADYLPQNQAQPAK